MCVRVSHWGPSMTVCRKKQWRENGKVKQALSALFNVSNIKQHVCVQGSECECAKKDVFCIMQLYAQCIKLYDVFKCTIIGVSDSLGLK